MDASNLILDYVAICEKTGVLLDFGEFIPLWIVANEIAEERVSTPSNHEMWFLSNPSVHFGANLSDLRGPRLRPPGREDVTLAGAGRGRTTGAS